jgi:hypothetical protein
MLLNPHARRIRALDTPSPTTMATGTSSAEDPSISGAIVGIVLVTPSCPTALTTGTSLHLSMVRAVTLPIRGTGG